MQRLNDFTYEDYCVLVLLKYLSTASLDQNNLSHFNPFQVIVILSHTVQLSVISF